jgi:hypothetical protein
MQIPTQRSWIPRFRPDGPIMHPDAHQCQEAEQFKVAYVRTLFRVREDSNFLSQTQSGKTACTRSDARATPFGRQVPLIKKLRAYSLHPSR